MTWAKNFSDRYSGGPSPSEKRAKKVEKTCAKCGTGIENRKTYCGPCYDIRYQENVVKNRKRR